MKYSNDVAMTWKMKWLNRSVATINATLQLLDIYRYVVYEPSQARANRKENHEENVDFFW